MDIRLAKQANGHDMELFGVHEQGGGLEEIVFWCHSCDPTGAVTHAVDTRTTTPLAAVQQLHDYAKAHSE